MSISKTVVKLAAAALVVAGGVGTVWAQATPVPNTSATIKAGGDVAASMSATYTVEQTAEIAVTPNNPTSEKFIGFDADASSLDGADGSNGNLGTVRVKTNSRGWDVTFTTVNGGKLAMTEVKYDTTKVLIPGKFPPEYRDSIGSKYGTPKYLCYIANSGLTDGIGMKPGATTSDADTAELMVGVGMLERVGGVNYLKGYPNGLSAKYATPLVTYANLRATQTLDATGTAIVAGSITPASFAKIVGNGTAISATQTALGAGREMKVGGVVVGATAGQTGLAGFGPTNTALSGLPGVTKSDDSEYFYVNVGIPSANELKMSGNTKGDYTETFTFTLLANF